MPETALLDDGAAELGRRERKKIETRAALQHAAIELFVAKGVDTTTVEEIADRVDVSPRTFHRYFAAKEDVLFADADERLATFTDALRARPDDEPLLEALAAAAQEMAGALVSHTDDERRRLLLIRSTVSLRARNLHYTDEWSNAVAALAADRLGLDPRDPLPILLGACTIAALRTAIDRWLESPRADYHAELARSFALLADLPAATTPRRTRIHR